MTQRARFPGSTNDLELPIWNFLGPISAAHSQYPEEVLNITFSAGAQLVSCRPGQDLGQALQAAHDANPGSSLMLDVTGGASYSAGVPVFLDEAGAFGNTAGIAVNGNGATVLLQPTLPNISSLVPDPLCKGFFFPNTLRSAWNTGAGTVNADTAHQALAGGGGKTKPKLALINFTFDFSLLDPNHGGGALFANGVGSSIEYCRFIGNRFGLSWNDYSDRQTLRCCSAVVSTTAPLTVPGYGIWQWQSGDSIDWSHNNGRLTSFYCKGANGAMSVGGVAAQQLFQNAVFHCLELHSEDDQAGASDCAIRVLNSIGYIGGGQINAPHLGNLAMAGAIDIPGAIYIDDSNNLAYGGATYLELDQVSFKHHYRGETDPQFLPDVLIHSFNPDSCLKLRDCFAFLSVPSAAQAGVKVASDDPLIQTALVQGAGLRSFEVWQRAGTWVVTPLNRGPRHSRKKPRPTGLAVVNNTSLTGTIATTREYAVALLDELQNYGQASSAVSVGIPSTGANRLRVSAQGSGTLVVWSSDSAGSVLATPARYALIPWAGQLAGELWDTGARIDGVQWVSASVPVPNTVAAVDHTVCKLQLDDGTLVP